jgi:hypothetical protein
MLLNDATIFECKWSMTLLLSYIVVWFFYFHFSSQLFTNYFFRFFLETKLLLRLICKRGTCFFCYKLCELIVLTTPALHTHDKLRFSIQGGREERSPLEIKLNSGTQVTNVYTSRCLRHDVMSDVLTLCTLHLMDNEQITNSKLQNIKEHNRFVNLVRCNVTYSGGYQSRKEILYGNINSKLNSPVYNFSLNHYPC